MTAPINTATIPPQVRAEGPAAEALYSSAQQFEQLLVQQLAKSLTDATQSPDTDDEGDGGSTSPAGGSGLGPYQSMLPDALAQSVTGGGGAGLALDLYRSLGGKESKS